MIDIPAAQIRATMAVGYRKMTFGHMKIRMPCCAVLGDGLRRGHRVASRRLTYRACLRAEGSSQCFVEGGPWHQCESRAGRARVAILTPWCAWVKALTPGSAGGHRRPSSRVGIGPPHQAVRRRQPDLDSFAIGDSRRGPSGPLLSRLCPPNAPPLRAAGWHSCFSRTWVDLLPPLPNMCIGSVRGPGGVRSRTLPAQANTLMNAGSALMMMLFGGPPPSRSARPL